MSGLKTNLTGLEKLNPENYKIVLSKIKDYINKWEDTVHVSKPQCYDVNSPSVGYFWNPSPGEMETGRSGIQSPMVTQWVWG